jgi:hypothetical protein
VLTLLKVAGQAPNEVGVATVKIFENLIPELISASNSVWFPEASLIHLTEKAPPYVAWPVCRSPARERMRRLPRVSGNVLAYKC